MVSDRFQKGLNYLTYITFWKGHKNFGWNESTKSVHPWFFCGIFSHNLLTFKSFMKNSQVSGAPEESHFHRLTTAYKRYKVISFECVEFGFCVTYIPSFKYLYRAFLEIYSSQETVLRRKDMRTDSLIPTKLCDYFSSQVGYRLN